MKGYILGVDADSDLDEIWVYSAGDNIDAADRCYWTAAAVMGIAAAAIPRFAALLTGDKRDSGHDLILLQDFLSSAPTASRRPVIMVV